MLSFLRFVVTGLLFLLSAAMLAKSLWVSWALSITLIIVISLPSSRYPLLKGKRRWVAILLVLLSLLVSLHLEQETMRSRGGANEVDLFDYARGLPDKPIVHNDI